MENHNKENPTDTGTLLAGDMSDTLKLESDTSCLFSPRVRPVVMLLYPLYASVLAIESPSKADDEQWLAYWILYSFLTLSELILQSLLEWIPIWYTAKLVLVAWLVLPQFRGAAFIYNRVVREQFRKYGILKPKVNYFIFNHFPIFL
ncbi:hypothetical protein HID58_051656 [Brassica napus]|uniref:HVA22-like protein n=2 Tax=Brassica TaxID=3705 RepID=A0ABQ8A9K0_BRANA|nr:hypothetical protein F2Q68_00001181 [Brassica cretica]KAH0889227.1 hypothetical protein HID58_051656 [Brassica napus]